MGTDKAKADMRAKRLEKQLRANLARRKQQARATRGGKADQRGEGLPGAESDSQASKRER